MAEEMNAMKQVFMRMSEKKVQQKEERKAECKRIYAEAFERNVDKLFKRASRSRAKTLDQITAKIDGLKKGLYAASEDLRDAHSAYSKKFDADIDQAQADIQRLRDILRELDGNYAAAQTRVQKEFETTFEDMEDQIQQLQGKLQDAWNDRSTLSAFRPQLERLL
ncbi:hypothetical protein PINS_up014015 [Pythium insidiosum]|nr:hypothetical protein PINS_up014015 [Pythium insidiosum]